MAYGSARGMSTRQASAARIFISIPPLVDLVERKVAQVLHELDEVADHDLPHAAALLGRRARGVAHHARGRDARGVGLPVDRPLVGEVEEPAREARHGRFQAIGAHQFRPVGQAGAGLDLAGVHVVDCVGHRGDVDIARFARLHAGEDVGVAIDHLRRESQGRLMM